MNPNRLLVVDDDAQVCDVVVTVGEDSGFDCAVATSVRRFAEVCDEIEPTVIVLDLNLADGDGVEMLRDLAERGTRAGIILISDTDERTSAAVVNVGLARELNMLASLRKPLDLQRLASELRSARTVTEPVTVDAIREGLAAGDFDVHYLPIIERRAPGLWRVASAEALVRWHHKGRAEVIYPGQFMGVAEAGGAASEITDFVLHRSVEQLRIWRDAGLELGVAVNFNAALLADLEFPDRLELLVNEQDLEPGCLTLEFTETAPLEEPQMMIDILTRLRLKGFHLALDDFGTGHSSFTQLTRMPFSEVKIDRTLMEEAPQRSDAATILRALVQLGHTLGLSVCAEGVDRPELFEYLQKLDCDRIQGHLISRALSAGKLQRFLESWDETAPAAAA